MPKFHTYVTPVRDDVRVEFEISEELAKAMESGSFDAQQLIDAIEAAAGFAITEEYPTVYNENNEIVFEY